MPSQSHYIEIAQGDIFMEQKMRFGLVLGRLAILKKNFVSCFDIGEVPRSPGKWNWNWLYFLPFIFTFEQGVAEFADKQLIQLFSADATIFFKKS